MHLDITIVEMNVFYYNNNSLFVVHLYLHNIAIIMHHADKVFLSSK